MEGGLYFDYSIQFDRGICFVRYPTEYSCCLFLSSVDVDTRSDVDAVRGAVLRRVDTTCLGCLSDGGYNIPRNTRLLYCRGQ